MKNTAPSCSPIDPACLKCLRFGWTAIAAFMLLGLVLESFHLIKAPFYFDLHLRRELFTLAHAHGTLFGILNVVFALTAERCLSSAQGRQRASLALRIGALLVPLGFLLGAIGAAEGDPSLLISLVPVGALLVLGVAAVMAWGARGEGKPTL